MSFTGFHHFTLIITRLSFCIHFTNTHTRNTVGKIIEERKKCYRIEKMKNLNMKLKYELKPSLDSSIKNAI